MMGYKIVLIEVKIREIEVKIRSYKKKNGERIFLTRRKEYKKGRKCYT